jgi:transketolase
MDVTILYYTTLAPFDAVTLAENCETGAVAVVEPFYEGTLAPEIMAALSGRSVRLLSLGVPRRPPTSYGRAAEHDLDCGLTGPQIRSRLQSFLDAGN